MRPTGASHVRLDSPIAQAFLDENLKRALAPAPTTALATLTFADTAWDRLASSSGALTAFVVPKQLR
jgi:hypothetical protein